MDLYPAIDLRGGRCVRLRRGDFAEETVYDDDPVRVATDLAGAGARWIHVVDLDAARTGEPAHREVIAAICESVTSRIQVGGGVRTREVAAALLAGGVDRVVVGTAAVEQPELVVELAARFPGAIAVGLDAREGEVAVRGWQEGSGLDLVELAARFAGSGAAALVVTEIGRDGTLEGPAFDQLAAVLEVSEVPVVASGGVGTLADLRTLAGVQGRGRRLAGVVVGVALYEGRFTVAEALAALDEEG